MKKGRCALTPQARMTATPSRLCPGLDTMWPGYRPHALGGPCKRLAYTPTFPSRVVCSLQPPPTGRWGGRERRGRGPRPAAQGFRTWLPSGSPWPRHPQPSRRETAPLGPGQRWKGSRKSGCARMGGGLRKAKRVCGFPYVGWGFPLLVESVVIFGGDTEVTFMLTLPHLDVHSGDSVSLKPQMLRKYVDVPWGRWGLMSGTGGTEPRLKLPLQLSRKIPVIPIMEFWGSSTE